MIKLNGLTLISAHWFGEVGIVTVVNDIGERKAYVGKCIDGNSEEQDIKRIMQWGNEIYPQRLEVILEELSDA